jgi:hypothetical protein
MADEAPKKTPEEQEAAIAKLTADLAAEREGRGQDRSRLDTYEKTLAALGRERQQPTQQMSNNPAANFGMIQVTADDIRFYKSLYPESTDEQIAQYARMRKAELAYEAQPIVNRYDQYLGNAADILDRHDVMVDEDVVKDYKPHKKEIEALRQEYLESGRPVPRRAELTQIVKARKIPELVKAETERQMAEAKARQESAASATTETTTVSTGRPNPAAAPKKNLAEMDDKERNAALAGMSAKDRAQALEDAIGDTPIP